MSSGVWSLVFMVTRWPNAEAIQSDGAVFAAETGQIFDALRLRGPQEDAEIFPRLDET